MQKNVTRLTFGHRQPSASITFGSRGRRFPVAHGDQWRDPGVDPPGIRWISVEITDQPT